VNSRSLATSAVRHCDSLAGSDVRHRRFSFTASLFLHGSGISAAGTTAPQSAPQFLAGFLLPASSWTTRLHELTKQNPLSFFLVQTILSMYVYHYHHPTKSIHVPPRAKQPVPRLLLYNRNKHCCWDCRNFGHTRNVCARTRFCFVWVPKNLKQRPKRTRTKPSLIWMPKVQHNNDMKEVQP
jgi:hypothetical protein